MSKKVRGSWRVLLVDMRVLMRSWKLIGKIRGGELVPRPFRERLMLLPRCMGAAIVPGFTPEKP